MLPAVLFQLFQRYEVGNPQPTVSLIGLPAEGKKLGKKRDGFAVLALRHRLWLLLAFCAAVVLWITPGFLALIWGAQSAPAKYYNSRFPEAVAALVAAQRHRLRFGHGPHYQDAAGGRVVRYSGRFDSMARLENPPASGRFSLNLTVLLATIKSEKHRWSSKST